jgi:hypothetical protein
MSVVTMWMIQVQLLLQIIINRTALIMVDRRKVRWLKWGVASIVTLVNISGIYFLYDFKSPSLLSIHFKFTQSGSRHGSKSHHGSLPSMLSGIALKKSFFFCSTAG